MDKINFFCALCGESLRVRKEIAGGFCDCPRCARVIPVPGFPARPGQPAEYAAVFSPDILGIEIKFLSSCCGNKLQVDARQQGVTLDCPVCQKQTKVPAWGGELPPAQPAEASSRASARMVRLSAEEVEFLSTPMKDSGPGLLAAAGK